MTSPIAAALEAVAGAQAGALILVGPGAPDDLPPAIQRRHLPGGGVLLPLAEGARLVDPTTPVIAIGGDGDIYGEGLGHLLHAVRRNTGVTCFVANNGLAAPGLATAGPGRPAALALAAGATFVAEVPPEGDLAGIARQALDHPGFALIDISPGAVPAIHQLGTGQEAFESIVIGVSPLVTTVSTTEWEDWERIIYYVPGGEDDDGPDDDGAGA